MTALPGKPVVVEDFLCFFLREFGLTLFFCCTHNSLSIHYHTCLSAVQIGGRIIRPSGRLTKEQLLKKPLFYSVKPPFVIVSGSRAFFSSSSDRSVISLATSITARSSANAFFAILAALSYPINGLRAVTSIGFLPTIFLIRSSFTINPFTDFSAKFLAAFPSILIDSSKL